MARIIRISNLDGSLRGRAHFAAASAAGALTRRFGGPGLLIPALRWLGGCFGHGTQVRLSVRDQVAIDVPLSDAYWAAAGINGTYEVELFRFFDCLPPHTTLFVDCGANIGWWSLLAEKRWGWDCVAIEASGALVARLERARNANAAHFTIFHKAVWNRDGELLSFRTGDGAHAAGHIAGVTGFVSPRRVPDVERVESITVDTILAQRTRAAFDRVIVKLDVEGAELQAIEGAKRTIAEGALVIYEDHGSDRRCRPTAMLLEMGLNVYTLEPALMRIGKLEDAARLKRNPRKGYNFLACSAPAPESL